ncbi:MAG: hypothetical protein ACI90V_010559 [Bacillariaceae sp.]|jgi:hypothetical protein
MHVSQKKEPMVVVVYFAVAVVVVVVIKSYSQQFCNTSDWKYIVRTYLHYRAYLDCS